MQLAAQLPANPAQAKLVLQYMAHLARFSGGESDIPCKGNGNE